MTYHHLDPSREGERLARRLERMRGYRVLRRLPLITEMWCRSMPVPTNTFTVGVVDTETTGLDPERHRLIEIAVGKLTIDLDHGDVTDVTRPVSWLECPGELITPEIEALTGITDALVAGEAFPDDTIMDELAGCDLLVSHNAGFDCAFMVRRFPQLGHPWACSAKEVDWAAHGLAGGRSIGALLTTAGHFLPDAHRAAPDVWALTCLLARAGVDGRSVAAHLVDTARRPTARAIADRAPFEVKNSLKAAGYRWSPVQRAWWLEGEPERIANETAWLATLHPAIRPRVEPVDWFTRHA